MALVVSRRGNIVPAVAAGVVIPKRRANRARRSQAGNTNNGARLRQLAMFQPQVQRVPPPPPVGRRRNRRRARGSVLSAPATFGFAQAGGQPRFASSTLGGCTVSHSEIIRSPNGSTAFTGVALAMVPNNFAWLDGLAKNFSRYRWLSLRIDYVTASPTSQGGTIGMGATYDALDALPNSMAEMNALAHSFVGPVWTQPGQTMHSVSYDATRWSRPWYSYTNVSQVPNGAATTAVPSYLLFATQTQVNGQLVGHIVATYTMEFLDPIPARINTGASTQSFLVKEFANKDEETKEIRTIDERISAITDAVSALVLPGGSQRAIGPSSVSEPASTPRMK